MKIEQVGTAEAMRKCKECGRLLPLGEFYRTGTSKEGRWFKCKDCVRAYQRERNRRPEVNERMRAYWQEYAERPEVAARLDDCHREYRKKPEVRERKRRYSKNRYSIERRRAYHAISTAVARGEMRPARELKCVDCGKQATQYFYENYEVPPKVTAVCGSCHRRRVSGTEARWTGSES